MKLEDLELDKLKNPLEESLRVHASLLDQELAFQDFPDFNFTPNKANTARTVIPVTYAGAKAGEMYVIVFLQKDGTGDDKTFKLDEIKIPPELRNGSKPERVVPRAKNGVIAEIFFPLFSLNRNNYVVPFAAHLDELTLNDEKTIIKALTLGQNRSTYLQAINSGLELIPKIKLTTGNDKKGKRFGDPHAIYYSAEVYDAVQVAGFLTIREETNPLLNLITKRR